MSEPIAATSTAAASASAPPPTPAPAAQQPCLTFAVKRCCSAYNQAHAAARSAGATDCAAREKGKEAFRKSMPCLTSRNDIREFIACVAQGMLLDVFFCDEAPKLLAAAKAAVGALPRESNPVGRSKSGDQLQ